MTVSTEQRESIIVGLGEMQVLKGSTSVLSCIGLGSCIALCIYDPVSRIGAMAHMVMPEGNSNSSDGLPAKYVNSGVPLLIQKVIEQGALRSRLKVKIAGGARMLSIPGNNRLDIGERNIVATKEALVRERVSLSGAETGGTSGRSVQMLLDSGDVFVKVAGGQPIKI